MMLPKVKLQTGGEIDFIDYPQEIHPGRLFVVTKLGDYKDKIVLDIGCGTHKCVPEAIGIDIKPVTDIQASAESLNFEDSSVDIIISRHSFEHFLDPVQVLEEWIRVLKPGGKIIFVLPDHRKIDTMQPSISGGTHLHAYTPDSLRRLLSRFPELDVSNIKVVIENWSFGAVATLKPFGKLIGFDKVVVSGPPRSGTRIATRIIAEELGYTYVDEAEFKNTNLTEFWNIIRNRHKIVVHCPAMCRVIHDVNMKDTAVIFMRRSIADITASQKRVGWDENSKEWLLKVYGKDDGNAAEVVYNFWENHQRNLLKNTMELEYESLSYHPLWLSKEDRKNLPWHRTDNHERFIQRTK